MNTLMRFVDQPLIDALGWTLLHFLWQGLLIAGVVALLVRGLVRRSANERYLVLCGGLLVMALCPPVTAWWLMSSSTSVVAETVDAAPIVADRHLSPLPEDTIVNLDDETAVDSIAGLEHAPALSPGNVTTAPQQRPWTERLKTACEPALPWVVTGWLTGVLILGVRLLAGWRAVQRLRRTATAVAATVWQERLRTLARRLRISRPVQLVESALVEVPTVIGWLRPTILLPVSALTGLQPGQLEALLAHELAHIRRHDYLVNLVQLAIETLLFYHPAVWWLSRRIREERENCCDDIAAAVCGDTVTYARALAVMEELRTQPQFALAADGGSLLGRVQRLVQPAGELPSRTPSGLLVILCTFAGLAVLFALSGRITGLSGNDTVVVVEWSAMIDQPVLDEIRRLAPEAVVPDDAQGTWMLRTSADELRSIIQRRREGDRQVTLNDHADFALPSPPSFRPTGIAHTLSHVSNRQDANANWRLESWTGGGTRFIEDADDGALVSLNLDLGIQAATGRQPNGVESKARLRIDERIPDGRAAVAVQRVGQFDEWEPSLIVVWEAIRVPRDSAELYRRLHRADDWFRHGPIGTQRRLARARDWQRRARPATPNVAGPWTQQLEGGGHIELVALSRPQEAPFVWWDPEGRPIEGADISSLQIGIDQGLIALIRVWETGIDRRPLPQGSNRAYSGIMEVHDPEGANLGAQWLVVPAELAGPDGQPRLRVGAGFGEWTDAATIDAVKDATATIGGDTIKFATLHDFRQTVSPGFFWKPTGERDLAVEAVTPGGQRVSPTSPANILAVRPPDEILGSLYSDLAQPKEDIDHFVIKSRPCQWAEFTHFAVEPAATLQPPLDWSDPDAADESAADATFPKRFIGWLPNGISVELVGITKNTAPAADGWRPDGTSLDGVPDWPKGLVTYGGNTTGRSKPDNVPVDAEGRDFLFEFRGLQERPELTFDLPGGASFSHDPVSDLYRLRVTTRVRDDSRPRTVRVGLTTEPWGPWLQIGPTGTVLNPLPADAPYRSHYEAIEIVRAGRHDDYPDQIILELRRPNSHGTYSFELRAIDTDNESHSTLLQLSRSTGDGAFNDELWRTFSPLPADRFQRYEFRLRPYRHRVTFDNVALQPGQPTTMTTKVETVADATSSADPSVNASAPDETVPQVASKTRIVLTLGYLRAPNGERLEPGPVLFHRGEEIALDKFPPHLEELVMELRETHGADSDRALAENTVTLRVDQKAPAEAVQRLIAMCQEAGFQKFSLKAVKNLNGATTGLEFRIVAPQGTPKSKAVKEFPIRKPEPHADQVGYERDQRWYALLWNTPEHALLNDGSWNVTDCQAQPDPDSGDAGVRIHLTLDEAGGEKLRQLTRRHIDQRLAIVVDGQILSAPVIRAEIGGRAAISGNFTREEAEALAAAIRPADKPKD